MKQSMSSSYTFTRTAPIIYLSTLQQNLQAIFPAIKSIRYDTDKHIVTVTFAAGLPTGAVLLLLGNIITNYSDVSTTKDMSIAGNLMVTNTSTLAKVSIIDTTDSTTL